ncbi:MAG: Arm DNA-binding domain-containing protein [Candidatus Binataceae bacterium]
MAVRVKAGKLFLDFRWRGVRCREFTGMSVTPENKRKAEAFNQILSGELGLGTFDYRKHFPNGARLREFYGEQAAVENLGRRVLGGYLDEWHQRRSPFLPNGTVASNADLHPSTWMLEESIIRCHLKPSFGALRVSELMSSHCKEYRKALQDKELSGKTAQNILGVLHKAMADAVEDGLVETNPVPQFARKKRSRIARSNSDPLTVAEVGRFLSAVPSRFRDLYDIWLRVGWRPSEILAVRFDWLDFHRQTVHLRRGRIARWGGVEAPPKTGEREVDCAYDPAIFQAFGRLKRRSLETGKRDFVFTDQHGSPLSQEWLHKKVWLPTLRMLGLRTRGQYNIRDTFITLALTAGEDPGWVAQVCGTSERMIFEHYRKWMKNLRREDGRRIANLYREPDRDGHSVGTGVHDPVENALIFNRKLVATVGVEPTTLRI